MHAGRKWLAATALVAGVISVAGATAHRANGGKIAFSGGLAGTAVLFHGWRDSKCQEAEVLVGDQLNDAGDASQPGTADCRSWVVAFARGKSPALMMDPSWVVGATPLLNVDVTAPLTVDIEVWVVTDQSGAQPPAVTLAEGSIVEANAVFEEGRTGIVLNRVDVHQVKTGDLRKAVIGGGCGQVDALVASVGKPEEAYRPNAINVYLVSTIYLPDTQAGITRGTYNSDRIGQNCYPFGHPEIIYLDYGYANAADVGTLAHEIGHGLGLQEPDDGHTDNVGGLDNTDNFMKDGWQETGGQVSLGQVFRMRFDSRSWLNRGGTLGSKVFTCETAEKSDWPCPRLSRRVQ